MQDRATLGSAPSGILDSERAVSKGIALFLLLILKPKAITPRVKGQSPLVYNLGHSRGRMVQYSPKKGADHYG